MHKQDEATCPHGQDGRRRRMESSPLGVRYPGNI